ncbi:MAG: alpha/beta hydrolase [Amphiplicatus sp.]
MRSIAAALILALGCLGGAGAEPPTVKSEAPVAFPTWRQIVLTSPSLKRDFMVRVIPPVIPPASGQKAAAIYLLDGNLYSGMAADTMRLMALDGSKYAPAYVIAIGYDTTSPAVVIQSRQNDYLRTKTVEPGKATSYGGGGAAFETFLVEELKPYLETRLPIDPKQSFLAGHSYGGLFTANLAAHRTDQFAGYAIGSPSIWADRGALKALEAQKGDKRKVFVGVGALEVEGGIDMVKDAGAVADAMGKAGFIVEKRVYAGQDHGASPNAFLADSFRYLLAAARP